METRGDKPFASTLSLFRSFPRKGMETTSSPIALGQKKTLLFRSFPRKGMETTSSPIALGQKKTLLFRSFPRKGMETALRAQQHECHLSTFPLISPQGDGNAILLRTSCSGIGAFPLISPQGDGNNSISTEGDSATGKPFPLISPQGDGNSVHTTYSSSSASFSAHFPARGWKLHRGLCSFPKAALTAFPLISPQGDGNRKAK